MSDPQTAPGFTPVYEELDAGIFDRKVSHAMAQTAMAVVNAVIFDRKVSHAMAQTAMAVVNAEDKGKKGRVTIEYEFERIGDGAQINMSHKLTYVRPTLRGEVQETDSTQTLLYVGKGGKMTITPDTQMDLIPKTRREVV